MTNTYDTPPEESDIDNAKRCNLFADALKSLQARNGGDLDATIVDLLADARHWCDSNGKDFYEFDRIAEVHYLAEFNDGQPIVKNPMTYCKTSLLPTGHTTGPWNYHPDEDGKPICNHGKFAIAYMDAYTPDEDDGGSWERETDANGNLVAAAPEMLDCLQDILAVFNQAAASSAGTHAIIGIFGDHDDSIDQAIRWRQKTRAAIAKATSQSSERRAA